MRRHPPAGAADDAGSSALSATGTVQAVSSRRPVVERAAHRCGGTHLSPRRAARCGDLKRGGAHLGSLREVRWLCGARGLEYGGVHLGPRRAAHRASSAAASTSARCRSRSSSWRWRCPSTGAAASAGLPVSSAGQEQTDPPEPSVSMTQASARVSRLGCNDTARGAVDRARHHHSDRVATRTRSFSWRLISTIGAETRGYSKVWLLGRQVTEGIKPLAAMVRVPKLFGYFRKSKTARGGPQAVYRRLRLRRA